MLDSEAMQLPVKLKNDSIIEAICEIRFSSDMLPEVVVGRLIDHELWKPFQKSRLQTADIPHSIRMQDENLRFQPEFELKNDIEPSVIIKIGTFAISVHMSSPYMGWSEFKERASKIIDCLFDSIDNVQVTRIGLRYINALKEDKHLINNPSTLKMGLEIAGEHLGDDFFLTYHKELASDIATVVRVACPMFARNVPTGTQIVVDVDVFTKEGVEIADKHKVAKLLEEVHHLEKSTFFSLFPKEILFQLIEE